MAQVSLTDQLGATAFIDQMRHKQLLVQEHLDLPARRAEAITRIREFYKAQGIEVSDEMVEQGARAYFDQRLTYQPPHLGKFQAKLASLYITREQWQKKAVVSVVAAAACFGLVAEVQHLRDVGATKDVQVAARTLLERRDNLATNIAQDKAKLNDGERRTVIAPLGSVTRLLEASRDPLSRAASLINIGQIPAVTKANRDDVLHQVQNADVKLSQAQEMIRSADNSIGSAFAVLSAKDRLHDVTSREGYTAVKAKYQTVADAERKANQALSSADQTGIQQVDQAVTSLSTLVSNASHADDVASQLRDLESQFKTLGLPASDMNEISASVASAMTHVQRLETAPALKAVSDLSMTLTYAKTPLTINAVDRAGVKTGIERAFHANSRDTSENAKSWYIIVEATDPAGGVVAVPATSVETGQHKYANIFGIRVTKEVFDRIRQDKKADGHVDDKMMGEKPANSLKIRYSKAFSQEPQVILEWQ